MGGLFLVFCAILYGKFCLVVLLVLNLSYRTAPRGSFFVCYSSVRVL